MNSNAIELGLNFDNSFAKQLGGFYVACEGDGAPAPELVKLNTALAKRIGLTNEDPVQLAQVLSGSASPLGALPLAQVYAGHQFGGFTPQLGDGRALLLGEVLDTEGQRLDLQLKGSGPTPFSRGGDGKAVMGAVLREYILSEAMHALNIPTTRALAVVATGESVRRDMLQPGAVLTRIASSHLRVGSFQFFAARGEQDKVKQLADYAIARHYPELAQSEHPYLNFLRAVRNNQASLIAKWLLVGFVHGVMNTDNMTISGETIDYGPCAFIDYYDADSVFSSIDREGRYAYSNQAAIGQWNLARLAETLLPLIDESQSVAIELATQAVTEFWDVFKHHWVNGMRAKLGLSTEEVGDQALGEQLLDAMAGENVDFTNLFRQLASDLAHQRNDSQKLFNNADKFNVWRGLWLARITQDPLTIEQSVILMNSVNPLFIARNHQVEQAIEAAQRHGDYQPFERLVKVLATPYTAQEGAEDYAKPAPASFGPFVSYCGT